MQRGIISLSPSEVSALLDVAQQQRNPVLWSPQLQAANHNFAQDPTLTETTLSCSREQAEQVLDLLPPPAQASAEIQSVRSKLSAFLSS